MKLLWFTNTPAGATKHLTGSFGVGGSWYEAMEKELKQREDIDLSLAFYWEVPSLEKFELEGVTYYAIPRAEKGKIQKYISRLKGETTPEKDLDLYLEVVKDFNPDLIHIYGSEKSFGRIIPHIETPVVIWLQGILNTIIKKWYAGLTREEINKYTPFLQRIKASSFNNEYRITQKDAVREAEILATAQYLIGRTNWDRRTSSMLAPNARYYVVNDLLRSDFYTMEWEAHRNRKQHILLTTLRDNIYKGFEDIVAIMQWLKPIYGDRLVWKIAGLGGDEEIVQLVRKKYKVDYSSIGIHLLGSLSADQITKELMGADIFVHPSHVDNCPNSVCEAMMIGLPIISTYVGGIPDIISNGEEGILIDDGDVTAMAAAIRELLSDKDKSEKIGKAARLKALERHDQPNILSDLLFAYKDILRSEGISIENEEMARI